jgi:hypothetical protein
MELRREAGNTPATLWTRQSTINQYCLALFPCTPSRETEQLPGRYYISDFLWKSLWMLRAVNGSFASACRKLILAIDRPDTLFLQSCPFPPLVPTDIFPLVVAFVVIIIAIVITIIVFVVIPWQIRIKSWEGAYIIGNSIFIDSRLKRS